MTFLAGERLWLLLIVPVLVVAYLLLQRRRRRYALRFTNLALLSRVAPRRPAWRRHVALGLTLASVGLMVTAFARPEATVRVPRERATIVVAVDVSISMRADDVSPTRLKAAQEAANAFVSDLPEKFNVALVSFAGTANILVPPTTNRDDVERAVNGLQLAESTATGEAIFTSLDAIKQVPPDPAHPREPPPARIVLLSDGYRNVGRGVDEAVAAAKAAKVPIYTIAFGTPFGTVDIEGQRTPVPVDEDTMRQIAQDTGGRSYTAESGQELEQVYTDIGSSVGYTQEKQEITSWWTGVALLMALCAAGASMFFLGRLP
ncbi:VWA domain-containing protein [Actinopolymorpha rutila]|uniref:Ca-activated chloride channel family protein n=1 Tax=Actinopolymorpha rutila TaxID=446787 RepID=A0A852ZD50_9ACTN|nr:VWA domain-containing protein [Actinopolymorpha rutila]NYH90233.1 Ca-activated chloride channel family protein [Actinopolymorpha rutila]